MSPSHPLNPTVVDLALSPLTRSMTSPQPAYFDSIPPWALKQTNVSQPSLIHSKPSLHSIAASQSQCSSAGAPDISPPTSRGHDGTLDQGPYRRQKDTAAYPPRQYGTLPSDMRDENERCYIHFALDQITRDEEVKAAALNRRGSRSRPWATPRIVPFEQQSGAAQIQVPRKSPITPTPIPTDSFIGTTEKKTRENPRANEECSHAKLLAENLSAIPSFSQEPMAFQQPLNSPLAPPNQELASLLPPEEENASQGRFYRQYSVQTQPTGELFPPMRREHRSLHPKPATKRDESVATQMSSTPGILRTPWLGVFIGLLLTTTIFLIACGSATISRSRLWPYRLLGDDMYFVSRYLPTMFGMAIYLWSVQIQVGIFRIAPLIAMSNPRPSLKRRAVTLPMMPEGFVTPCFGHFKAGVPVIGMAAVSCWLSGFAVPLLAASFNIYPHNGKWFWVATRGTIWTVITIYLLHLISIVTLIMWLKNKRHRLDHSPKSLADLSTLTENIQCSMRGRAASSAEADDYEQPSTEKMIPHHAEVHDKLSGLLPWFLQPLMATLWAVIATILMLAFLIVSYSSKTGVSKGFLPHVPARINARGFSPAEFLYSFVPALLGMWALATWLTIDYTYRRLQIIDVLRQEGCKSQPSVFPFVVTARAAANGHWKMALISFMSMITALLPILAGGVFWPQYYTSEHRTKVSTHMAAYAALTLFAVLCALAYWLIIPSRSLRKADDLIGRDPHGSSVNSLSGILALAKHRGLASVLAKA
ncbi:hypothetical protein K470DRAFT_258651 [Piedraia hortae CBS 480.64]|uniref:Uncharacterized protein n=1 Tax=Piedraia hortae CBS 480.64 TaxID=1314780 RepID=A0A6A7BXC5_9PEZI|nr:hypothetical protein K470DRAFT_258651 [Piedraia hortae CBS 480.64]